ncbi:MAG: glycosyltransferase [Ginsengibacter sp.]
MSNFIESKNPDYKNIKSDKYTIGVLKALSQDNCIGLIALSECTKNMQLEMLKAFPEFETILKSKITVLHPPQKLLINSIDQKGLSYEKDEALRFIFIGRDFLRKGGSEILKVFKEFSNDEQYKFELILITDINDKENFLFFNQKDIDNINNIISENPKWIKHYKELSNDKVLELIIKSHIGLLPTWMDTYGFSVLECQAGGCPVITTDIRALTEINNEELGWLIKFPANKLKHPIYESKKEFEICQEIIENGLRNILKDVFQNKQKIKEKAEASLNSIKTNHDEKKYTNQLKEIYEQKAFQEINKFHRKELTFSS